MIIHVHTETVFFIDIVGCDDNFFSKTVNH
jgi:hypothetical protein